jgi:2-hydroxy-3-keto-5-methylthiopentenyl-1-phosphate phosphatase
MVFNMTAIVNTVTARFMEDIEANTDRYVMDDFTIQGRLEKITEEVMQDAPFKVSFASVFEVVMNSPETDLAITAAKLQIDEYRKEMLEWGDGSMQSQAKAVGNSNRDFI